MIPISLPEAERQGAEVADKMCRRRWRVRYLAGQITKARVGFTASGKLARCHIFTADGEELSKMIVLNTQPAEWITLHYTHDGGWELPHD